MGRGGEGSRASSQFCSQQSELDRNPISRGWGSGRLVDGKRMVKRMVSVSVQAERSLRHSLGARIRKRKNGSESHCQVVAVPLPGGGLGW